MLHFSIKIGDYGASTVYRLPWETTVHMSTGLCGSEPYIAPEQFLGKRKPRPVLKLLQKPDIPVPCFCHLALAIGLCHN
jgi:serine/threonine protein kinase